MHGVLPARSRAACVDPLGWGKSDVEWKSSMPFTPRSQNMKPQTARRCTSIGKAAGGVAVLVLEPVEIGLDKYVDITIHHPFNISDLKIGPVVLHELVRVEYI
jgi:hypothetical protein